MARILVIEDSPENLELMSYLLQAFGHVALRAADGEQGLEIARREMPDLIVCDIHLPKVDGYEVARQLKRCPVQCSIPLIAVTALAMVGDRDKVLAAGFDGYIAKPIVPKRFVEQVEAYLRGRAASQAAAAPLAATFWHGRQGQMLVVDDSPTSREELRQTLESAGYEARPAGTVEDAMAIAQERVPDLILSDLHLPGGGFEFIRQAKANPRFAALPFIIVTSSMWVDRDRATARRLGPVRLLTRPIAPRALLCEIAACLPPPKGSADVDHPGC
jgi:two-component system, cell cycle response regulator